MSQENVEVVRRAFRSFNDRDFDVLLACYTDDVEWRLFGGFADLMGSEFRGRDALRRWFTDWIDNLGVRAEIEALREVEDQIVVVTRTVGAGGASGARATDRGGQIYSFRDGLISAVENYYEPNQALEAAGLRE